MGIHVENLHRILPADQRRISCDNGTATEEADMAGRLEGRVAIVTGGGHGIGKAYARGLAGEGASVVVAEIDAAAANAVAGSLVQEGFKAIAAATDVSDWKSVEAMARRALEAYGRIDVLVNNAAIFATVPMSRAPFDQIDPAEWDRMMAVNLRGPWLASRAVVPQMKAQRYGKIVNISSGTALKGSASRIHYVTSKAGILGFTRTLAREVGEWGICVNCVAPGSTLSEESPDEGTLKMRSAAVSDRALRRVQKPEDLVGAILFFASSDSDFVTGQTLVVDGGSAMH
jgi:3-oxoacyl-[acyl-carrier protein] reductase